MTVGLCSTSDIITWQNCYHLYSNSAWGKDLSNDTQIRVINRAWNMQKKMIRNLDKKLSKISLNYTWLCHDDAFSGILKLEASPVKEKWKAIKKKEMCTLKHVTRFWGKWKGTGMSGSRTILGGRLRKWDNCKTLIGPEPGLKNGMLCNNIESKEGR